MARKCAGAGQGASHLQHGIAQIADQHSCEGMLLLW
jgi:hypothetical protein